MARNKIIRFVTILIFLFSLSTKSAFSVCQPGCGKTIPCSDVAACMDCPNCIDSIQRGGKDLGVFKGLGILSDFISKLQASPDNPAPAAATFSKFISTTIGIMTVVAFIWFIFVLFSGAIAWLSSGGDKTKLQNAQKQITTGLVGLLIVITAIFLIKIIGVIFGFDILNIAKYIENIF